MSTSRLDEIRAKLRASIRDATNQSIDDMLPESKRPSSTPDSSRPHSFCHQCGHSFTEPTKFCPGCGASQAGAASESMPSARSLPASSAVSRRFNPLNDMQSTAAKIPAADTPRLPLRPGCKALCIGMGNYERKPLPWPRKDAEDLSDVLNGLGYQVSTIVDRNFQATMLDLLSFIQCIEPGDDIVFTYSGHGCGLDAVPNLTALDTNSPDTMINVYKLLIEPAKARQAKSVVIATDACRDNSYVSIQYPWEAPAETKAIAAKSLGTRRPEDEFGFAIIYGSSHDMSSHDSPFSQGIQNGLFTYFFKSEIARQGQSLMEVFRRVQKSVMDLSLSLETIDRSGFQKPALTNELAGDYYFYPVR
jgi:hypothetical protein